MPRRDWNKTSAHSQKPHHARMHSAAKGKGHDAWRRLAKQGITNRRKKRRDEHERPADR